jgi:hypothetical protein
VGEERRKREKRDGERKRREWRGERDGTVEDW